MDHSDTRAFVAQLAPQVDRLYIAGHAAARPLAPEVRRRFGLQGFGLLIALRPLLLSAEGMPIFHATAVLRYDDPVDVSAALEAHAAEGLLRRHDGMCWPTDRGRDVLLALTDILEEGVCRLWSAGHDAVRPALESLGRVIARARDTLDLELVPAFAAQATGYLPPDASPAFRLWSSLQTVRYLRADAHARAWEEAGLDRVTIQCLSSLHDRQHCANVAQMREATGLDETHILTGCEALARAGRLSPAVDGWQLTEAGREMRDRIESRTNLLDGERFAVLDATARSDLLHTLEALPGASTL